MVEIENPSQPSLSPASGETNSLLNNQAKSDQPAEVIQPTKKKRSLPGMPDPDAEVIALSPKTLLATNRFICEVCNKGFQRDQNLQLHRRGHNLPWKLRQRTSKEIKKRVYVCPEPTCIHHDRSRALGDLTGIKKHFCRKHGEKKYKCERCSKKYAVQSDWKAHMKTCGTREYRCDSELPENQNAQLPPPPLPQPLTTSTATATMTTTMATATIATNTSSSTSSGGVFASILNPSTSQLSQSIQQPSSSCSSGLLCPMAGPDQTAVDPVSLSLSSSLFSTSPLFSPTSQNAQPHYVSRSQPALSATALLQKAAEMGATSSNSSFLRGLGLALPSQDNTSTMSSTSTSTGVHDWNNNRSLSSGLGLGLRSSGPSSYNELMMSPSTLFGNKPTTLDFLGLGMGASEASSGGFSAFLNSIGGGLNMTTTSFSGDAWDDSSERKPSLL
ncbi:hypothetical protein CDL12_15186 [Handroanthus impetiginosus]|uniref:C2H2-type domain-containing protein n=1 Tax=Handroanthus impetiginosus TaxID=429701 RepID=A0A2G9H3X5_9LAMI|nr:hypothetical protein CDL12_15186 [Handroanthus impetiginosus]